MSAVSLYTPLQNTYWVLPNRFLAGEYPGDKSATVARQRLSAMLDSGLDCFIDLTTPADRMEPYAELLAELSGGRARHLSFGLKDMSVPDSTATMTAILDAIDKELGGGHKVYVHCWGGIGRTGTVIGCWLRRQYPDTDGCVPQADGTLMGLPELWKTCPKSARYPDSPQTPEQRAFVAAWPLGRSS
ncbi:MAG: protein-tyrosine phosphatase family protein [Clostridia bacterium]|jgi:hypothetical protein